jgi:hypothetical protein
LSSLAAIEKVTAYSFGISDPGAVREILDRWDRSSEHYEVKEVRVQN